MTGCDLHAGLQQALSRSDVEWLVGRSLRPPESHHELSSFIMVGSPLPLTFTFKSTEPALAVRVKSSFG